MEELPETKVVAVTALDDDKTVQEAFKAGFNGYLTKQTETERFTQALAERRGRPDGVPATEDRAAIGSGRGRSFFAEQLTTREVEVLQLLTEGASSDQMAEQLSVSPNTVRTHVQGILSQAAGPFTAGGRRVRRTSRPGETPHVA